MMSLWPVFCSPYTVFIALVAYYLLPYLVCWRRLDIPAPFPAAFTNLWLFYQCRRRRRYLAVDLVHQKYGKFVRIQPNHVSIADIEGIQAIYGHRNGFVKSQYYDSFASSGHRSIFNTRDRAEHSRKRKIVSHTFSAKSIGQFEQRIHWNTQLLLSKWNGLCERQADPQTGYVSINALPWISYLAFDITGNLVYGAPFGMLSREDDMAEVRKTHSGPATYALAIESLNRQGEVSATLGCYPHLKRFSKYLPDAFFRYGIEAFSNISGIATARVMSRLDPQISTQTHSDLLARLMEGVDEAGTKMGRDELVTETLTFLVAGSNTTSITVCSVLYWVLVTPGINERLQKVIDEVVPPGVDIPSFDTLKHVPYIHWVIQEALRIHSTSSVGLPRQIPLESAPVQICGRTFYPGDVISVPTYTLHHSQEIWGSDADLFVPERWDPARLTTDQKTAFIPFSTGPRACIGRNLAEMELACIVGALFRNFELRLEQRVPMETMEGFVRKLSSLPVAFRRRRS